MKFLLLTSLLIALTAPVAQAQVRDTAATRLAGGERWRTGGMSPTAEMWGRVPRSTGGCRGGCSPFVLKRRCGAPEAMRAIGRFAICTFTKEMYR